MTPSLEPKTIIIPVPVDSTGDVERLTLERDILIKRINELEKEVQPKKKRRTRAEMEADAERILSEYKSDGKLKARVTDSIRSYGDFALMQKYFWDKGNIRDWAFWTVGVSLGVRVSDLTSLKIKSVLNKDLSFKDRISIIETKTCKLNRCLITESIVDALTKYFESINWDFEFDDYLFKSQKGGKITEQHGWRIISEAGKAIKLPLVLGSHTMRKSFVNIVACLDKSTIDMNLITKIQQMLNHSDQRVTMKYLGTFRGMNDKARMAVSDFILGKSGINELIAGI